MTPLTLFAPLSTALILLASPVAAQHPRTTTDAPPGREFEFAVRELFFEGFRGDLDSFEEAMQICDETLARDPVSPEALVWHGSGEVFRAGMAFQEGDWSSGNALLEDGLAEMERAVRLAPERVEVRIPRAATLTRLAENTPFPEAARRYRETAVKDYDKIREIQAPHFAKMSVHSRGELMLGLASVYSGLQDDGSVREILERVRIEIPNSTYAAEASRYLSSDLSAPTRIRTCHGCHRREEDDK